MLCYVVVGPNFTFGVNILIGDTDIYLGKYLECLAQLENSGQTISFFSYRPIPINTISLSTDTDDDTDKQIPISANTDNHPIPIYSKK